MKNTYQKIALALIGLMLLGQAHAQSLVVYVDSTATGSNNGSSWANAYTELADALKWAEQNKASWTVASPLQVWVAKGTYKPLYSPEDFSTSWRDNSFLMVNHVQVYGGFTGNETSLGERDWDTNKTILSGDTGILDDSTDNAYHVVVSVGDVGSARLDGLTLTGGNGGAYGSIAVYGRNVYRKNGAGMVNISSSPTLMHVTIANNAASSSSGDGGGMYNVSSSPTLTHVTITNNTASGSNSEGGGMYSYDSSPILTHSTIIDNMAGGGGGGIYNSSSSTTIGDCFFFENLASSGGGMYNYNSSATITNSFFFGDSATNQGGGMYNVTSSPTINGCFFSEGIAANGGGMYNSSSYPTLNNCVFSENSAVSNGGGMYNDASYPMVIGCTFSENSADDGGGMYNSELIFIPMGGNTAIRDGIKTPSPSPSSSIFINRCIFSWNSASSEGGGMYNDSSSPTVINSLFCRNLTVGNGGGVYNYYDSSPALTNVTISDNDGYYGDGMYNDNSNPKLYNAYVSDFVYNAGSSSIDMQYSLVWNYVGGTNLDGFNYDNFQFADELNNNYKLGTAPGLLNPCTGAASKALYEAADGDSTNNSLANDLDLAGEPRLLNPGLEIGAYETNSTSIIPCLDTFSHGGNIAADTYQTGQSIQSSADLADMSIKPTIYRAGQYIILHPGFLAEAPHEVFEATIQGCE